MDGQCDLDGNVALELFRQDRTRISRSLMETLLRGTVLRHYRADVAFSSTQNLLLGTSRHHGGRPRRVLRVSVAWLQHLGNVFGRQVADVCRGDTRLLCAQLRAASGRDLVLSATGDWDSLHGGKSS